MCNLFLLSESLLSPILLLQLFSMAGFPSHSVSADCGADVSEGGAGHQLGNCASNPEILYEMKAVYCLREINLFWNVKELEWPWNILIIVPHPTSSGRGRKRFGFLQPAVIYWQLKIALFLCDLYLTVQLGEERLSQWQTPEWRWDPSKKWSSVWKWLDVWRESWNCTLQTKKSWILPQSFPSCFRNQSLWSFCFGQRFLVVLICRKVFGCVIRIPRLFANYFANSWNC